MTDVSEFVGRRRRRMAAAVLAGMAFAAMSGAQTSSPGISNIDQDPFSRPAYMPRAVIFFPPLPPPLDRPVAHVGSPMPARLAPPPELAAYVNELFYAPLGTRLARNDLGQELRQQLDTYRAAKLVLQRELRAELDQVREADAAAREHALAALARQQAPRLAELEKTAETLRGELVTGDYDWSALREWKLGEKYNRGDSPFEISAVMRAYAYYQKGLSAAQRRLLREISIELAAAAANAASAQAAQPFLFFPPEPARVLLPEDLPADLAARVAAYETKKSALKKELYDAVFAQDGASFSFLRSTGLKTLAGKQAARLAQLDTLADEIRRGLAQLPQPSRPVERSPLPPVLTGRIATLLQGRNALHKETMARVEAIRARVAGFPVQLSYSFENDGLKFIVVPRREIRNQPTEDAKHKLEALRDEMAAVAEDYGRRLAELANETEAIRSEATASLGNAAPRAVDAALGTAARVAALRDTEDAYREYRTAVFEPGLSPEQRRLLFDGAIEKLDLPLLRGELQPTRRAASW